MPRFLAAKSQLTDWRKRTVADLICSQVPRTEIAKKIKVNVATIGDWLREDEELKAAVEKGQQNLRARLQDRQVQIALGLVKSTPEVSYKALKDILDKMDETERREAGETSIKGMNTVMMEVCKCLYDMPEARARILEVYKRSRGAQDGGDARSGGVSLPEAEEQSAIPG